MGGAAGRRARQPQGGALVGPRAGEAELGLRFGGALWRFWYARGYISEGSRWLESILAGGGPAPARVKALEGMGWLSQFRAIIERARERHTKRCSGCPGSRATMGTSRPPLTAWVRWRRNRDDNERARTLLEENLSVLAGTGGRRRRPRTHSRSTTRSTCWDTWRINEDGITRGGTALWEKSLALARETGDRFRIGIVLCNLGYAALLQGDYERATGYCEEALTLAHELGSAGEGSSPKPWSIWALPRWVRANTSGRWASLKKRW